VKAWHECGASDILVGRRGELQRTIHSGSLLSARELHRPYVVAGRSLLISSHYSITCFGTQNLYVFPVHVARQPSRANPLFNFAIALCRRARPSGGAWIGRRDVPLGSRPLARRRRHACLAVQNADREIHVNDAVALAQWQYYLATPIEPLLEERAVPVIRSFDFWPSRVAFNPAKAPLEILG